MKSSEWCHRFADLMALTEDVELPPHVAQSLISLERIARESRDSYQLCTALVRIINVDVHGFASPPSLKPEPPN